MVEGNFQPIQHLAFPLNSTYDDFAAYNYENDSLFYFTSNRPGGAGREDLYWGKRVNYPDIAIPIVFSAIVVDGKTGLPLPFAEIEMTELGIGNEPKNLHVHKTDSHGSLRLNLESDKRYMMATLVDGYIPREIPILYKTEELEIPKEKNKEIRKTQEVLLFADTTGVTAAKDVAARYKIHNIYYDYDKYFIREDAAVELNKLVDLLQQHPNITIEVSSHTDTRASNEYNKHLSELRAMAAVKYIADKGIAPNRMTFQGMGETRPIYSPEKNELEQQMNRRTEFRITSVEYVAPPPPPAPIKQPIVDKKKK
jgi:outer membrane protein OmpA-like peptidoglycan-associated protein